MQGRGKGLDPGAAKGRAGAGQGVRPRAGARGEQEACCRSSSSSAVVVGGRSGAAGGWGVLLGPARYSPHPCPCLPAWLLQL